MYHVSCNYYHGNYIDEMTASGCHFINIVTMAISNAKSATNSSFLYPVPKIHKPNPVGRPIISGCDSPKERISSFVDDLLQPIAKVQESYLEDTTDFLNFIEKTTVVKSTMLVSMHGRNKPIYTNIPQEEGINIVCKTYETFHLNKPPMPTRLYLRDLKRKLFPI